MYTYKQIVSSNNLDSYICHAGTKALNRESNLFHNSFGYSIYTLCSLHYVGIGLL